MLRRHQAHTGGDDGQVYNYARSAQGRPIELKLGLRKCIHQCLVKTVHLQGAQLQIDVHTASY